MKKVLTTFIFLHAFFAFPQEATIDSLQKLLDKSSTADQKIDLYLKLFAEGRSRDIDSAYVYLENARTIFNKRITDSIKQNFYWRYSEYFLIKNQYDSTLAYVDQGLEIKKVNPIKLIDLYSIKRDRLLLSW
ncbi:MAG: hypothetical protein HC831_25945 [Chloroflexia bacterium]|nr:hypothetical protein [Chloroflexia bacterium]